MGAGTPVLLLVPPGQGDTLSGHPPATPSQVLLVKPQGNKLVASSLQGRMSLYTIMVDPVHWLAGDHVTQFWPMRCKNVSAGGCWEFLASPLPVAIGD